jgi:DNA-binding transcriptional MerR regulator/methylmalonyl-CoA mutase cobalamin-binding subunit
MMSIGVVARQTGIEASRLRKWESRYGFPKPQRHESGQRYYLGEDVALLQEVARRLAAGERIGKVMAELPGNASNLADRSEASCLDLQGNEAVKVALNTLRENHLERLSSLMQDACKGTSKRQFVEGFAAPLTAAVGESWADGSLPIHAEHFFSSMLESLLTRETLGMECGGVPTVLLTTPAGEKHTLGLAMVHAVLAEAGVTCIRLFSDLPVTEIVAACQTHAFRALGLSASLHYPPRLLQAQIQNLRTHLPENIELWLGGGGMHRIKRIPDGCRSFQNMDELIHAGRALQS